MLYHSTAEALLRHDAIRAMALVGGNGLMPPIIRRHPAREIVENEDTVIVRDADRHDAALVSASAAAPLDCAVSASEGLPAPARKGKPKGAVLPAERATKGRSLVIFIDYEQNVDFAIPRSFVPTAGRKGIYIGNPRLGFLSASPRARIPREGG